MLSILPEISRLVMNRTGIVDSLSMEQLMNRCNPVSSFPLVAEGLGTEKWAHLGDISHRSHPRSGLLQDRVLVYEPPERYLQLLS